MSKKLGTRHRAAIGLSELTDAFSLVISEESGKISVVRPKKISTVENIEDLRNQLLKNLQYQYDHGHNLIKSFSELLFGKYGEK
ncbi:MAG: DNA integrity scanning protein DisA nucleotide-binding domain protein [Deltaproteobacteria bacterium]|nr:DNA integrity scanning protein DisA nucleotide-binding domain protein [Deltaproteobacteria bacterium]